MKDITLSVGIPSYEAGENLVTTLHSIYAQTYYKKIKQILLVVDGSKINHKILRKIENRKLKIRYFKNRQGQSARINDLLKNLSSELIVLTNDDVVLDPCAIEFLMKEYSKNNVDLMAGCVRPLKPISYFQKALSGGYLVNHEIGRIWNQGKSYLTCNGRLICLSKKLYKSIKVPKNLWNNDAYIFLFSRIYKYRYKHLHEVICYYSDPENLKEYAKQSIKFQKSQEENQEYFSSNLSDFYTIPRKIAFKAMFNVFISNPFITFGYLSLLLYSRTHSKTTKFSKRRNFWETDKSTKRVAIKGTHLDFLQNE